MTASDVDEPPEPHEVVQVESLGPGWQVWDEAARAFRPIRRITIQQNPRAVSILLEGDTAEIPLEPGASLAARPP